MFRPRVIPCLLLKDKGLVKTIQFNAPTYVGDPMNAVKIFNDAKADELVFLDITATIEGRAPNIDIIKEIGEEAFMPFAVGGGINHIDHVKQLISAGTEKVIINSAAIENPPFIKEIAELYGRQSIIVSIDVKNENGKYNIHTHSGKKQHKLDLCETIQKLEDSGAGEIMINSIDNDGMQQGYDTDLIKLVSSNVQIPVIAIGGAGCYEDLSIAVTNGAASASAAGSIFVFIGKNRAVLINYPDEEELQDLFVNLQN